MSIRFAGPPTAFGTRLSAPDARAAVRAPDNDNGQDRHDTGEATLHAALRHFARDGLSAARTARQRAEAALHEGNDGQYRWWLDICRALDRRMAHDFVTSVGRDEHKHSKTANLDSYVTINSLTSQ